MQLRFGPEYGPDPCLTVDLPVVKLLAVPDCCAARFAAISSRIRGPGFSCRRAVLCAGPTTDASLFHWSTEQQDERDEPECRERQAPGADATGSTKASRDPDRGGRRQPVHFMIGPLVQNDPGTEETDTGQQPLQYPADSGGIAAVTTCKHDHRRGSQTDDRDRAQTRRLAVQVAVEPDDAAHDRRRSQA